MSDLQLFQETTPGMSYQALYQATWDQICKDFAHFCTPVQLTDPPTPTPMLEGIVSMLRQLEGDTLKINSLFYRIDLSEKKHIPHGDIQALAMMILRREAQKVWIRANYSPPSSEA